MKPITRKILIISALMVAILSACGTIEATDDSQQVTKLASKIADFELPAGFSAEFTTEMFDYTFVSYKGASGPSHLYLIQSKNEADGEELKRMLTQVAPGSSDSNTRMTVIENRTATVRGEEVAVIVSEGTNSENIVYRQLTVGFQGKAGPALLVFSDSVENWDQEAVDAFLQSIK